VRPSRPSPPIPQPTTSATTGFTYAYVPTRAGVEARSSHMYAVKPIRDETATMYTNAQTARGASTRESTRPASPRATPAGARITTPHSFTS
jgi:hypothetical protein